MPNKFGHCLKTATEMLHTDLQTQMSHTNLNGDLIAELLEIKALVESVGGVFQSRQAIAVAIVNWQKRHPDLKAYEED